MLYRHQGVTLIELMVVVTTIAILAATAIPIYQRFTTRSQLAAALADIAPGRTMVEVAVGDAANPADIDAEFVGLRNSSARCSRITAAMQADNSALLSCTVRGSAAIDGERLMLTRSSAGVWTCDATAFAAIYRPTSCG